MLSIALNMDIYKEIPMNNMAKKISGLILFITLLGSGVHQMKILAHEVLLVAKEIKEVITIVSD